MYILLDIPLSILCLFSRKLSYFTENDVIVRNYVFLYFFSYIQMVESIRKYGDTVRNKFDIIQHYVRIPNLETIGKRFLFRMNNNCERNKKGDL